MKTLITLIILLFSTSSWGACTYYYKIDDYFSVEYDQVVCVYKGSLGDEVSLIYDLDDSCPSVIQWNDWLEEECRE